MSEVLTTEEAASRLRVEPITIQRWLRSGKLPGTKLPGARGAWRIKAEDVERFLSGAASAEEEVSA